MSLAKWFFCLVAAQAGFLLGWAGWHQHLRSSAPVLLLHAHPYDPRDLLRGDYMNLTYDISNPDLPPDLKPNRSSPFSEGRSEVCVVLAPRAGYYEAVRVLAKEPSVAPGEVWVRGATVGWNGRVAYGIEEYYVPEGKGTPPTGARIDVEVSLSPTHRLYLHRVMVNGKNYP